MQQKRYVICTFIIFLKFAKDAFCGIIIVELGGSYWG
jgi:hypothetical protein